MWLVVWSHDRITIYHKHIMIELRLTLFRSGAPRATIKRLQSELASEPAPVHNLNQGNLKKTLILIEGS